MNVKLALIQMESRPQDPDVNFRRAEELITACAEREKPDIIVLPEMWNTGFCPQEGLFPLADAEGVQTKVLMSRLARTFDVNIAAGSVTERRGDKLYNTAYSFDRTGACVSRYDKIHLFTPAHEDKFVTGGNHTTVFDLAGLRCGAAICYDVRFPELIRTLALQSIDLLILPAQWPRKRRDHWLTLTKARAIENQIFVCALNGRGNSRLYDPWGRELLTFGEDEATQCAVIDTNVLQEIRTTINVYRDRRPELYHITTKETP